MRKLLFIIVLFTTVQTFAQGKPYGGEFGNPVARNQPFVDCERVYTHYIPGMSYPRIEASISKTKDSIYVLYVCRKEIVSGEVFETETLSCSLDKVLDNHAFFSKGGSNYFSYNDENGKYHKICF